jgi:hypothetical protein
VVFLVCDQPLAVQRALVDEVRVAGHPHLLKQRVTVHNVAEVEFVPFEKEEREKNAYPLLIYLVRRLEKKVLKRVLKK